MLVPKNYIYDVKQFKLCQIYKGGPKATLERDWYVYYYYNKYWYNREIKPIYERFRIKFDINKDKTLAGRLAKAKELAHAMDEMLLSGFNPYENARDFVDPNNMSVKQAIMWAWEKRENSWARKTKADLRGVREFFFTACEQLTYLHIPAKRFTKLMAREVLDTMVKDRGLGANAYLKYKMYLYGHFEYLKDWEKTDFNPFDFKSGIKKPKPKAKAHLSTDERNRLTAHLSEKHPDFLNYLMFLYYCEIRPKEIFAIKIRDISLKNQEIKLHAANTKDKEDRIVIIPQPLEQIIKDMCLEAYPDDWFVFGHNFTPESRVNPVKRDRSTKLWKELVIDGLGIESRMYWLKHLGLTRKRQAGVSADAVKLQAGHSSYTTTEESYIMSDRPELRDEIRNKTPKFND